MSYLQRVLQPGEQVRHISSIHWIGYWPGVAVAVLAAVAYWLSKSRLLPEIWQFTAYALALVAVVLLIKQWFHWLVTEIAVTNRRVIYKKGLIRRQTNEMNMDKVESVQIDQSILGRMLDYGDLAILGTGEGLEALRTIASPIELETASRERRTKRDASSRCGGGKLEFGASRIAQLSRPADALSRRHRHRLMRRNTSTLVVRSGRKRMASQNCSTLTRRLFLQMWRRTGLTTSSSSTPCSSWP